MIHEAIATGSTIDAAREKALAELNAPIEADVSFEIIDLPEKKTLGLFGGKDAKVKVFYDDGIAEKPKKTEKAKKPAKAAPAKKAAAPKAEKPKSKKRESAPVSDEAIEKTRTYILAVAKEMDLGEVEIQAERIEDGFCLTFTKGHLGSIIGRRGEILDALQYLASLCCNNDEDGYIRVVLDCNNYRVKREKTLTELAVRVAEQAKEDGQCQSLEPMNPYERRIIHTAVQEVEGISSWSVSAGKTRRVIIGPVEKEGTDVPRIERRRRDSGRGGRARGDRRGRGQRRPSQTVNAAPTREKMTDSADIPLFGKIN